MVIWKVLDPPLRIIPTSSVITRVRRECGWGEEFRCSFLKTEKRAVILEKEISDCGYL